MKLDKGDSALLLFDLGLSADGMGGSVLAQCYQELGKYPPDFNNPQDLKHLAALLSDLSKNDLVWAYHDRSDGGLLVTLCEMAFASHCGLDIELDSLSDDIVAALFNEELGVVVQVPQVKLPQVMQFVQQHKLAHCTHIVAKPNKSDKLYIKHNGKDLFTQDRAKLHSLWQRPSYEITKLRDNPTCVAEAYQNTLDNSNLGLQLLNTKAIELPVHQGAKPKCAIFREQGINGQREMAAAFMQAGFDCVDVHMQDLIEKKVNLNEFAGMAACGGFSFGDVLGAGSGWAQSIRHSEHVYKQFIDFCNDTSKFILGVCNGCQMLSHFRGEIAGTEHWPELTANKSKQFEGRFSQVRILASNAIMLQGMQDYILPITVAHGEGQMCFAEGALGQLHQQGSLGMAYCDSAGKPSELYPINPNGRIHFCQRLA